MSDDTTPPPPAPAPQLGRVGVWSSGFEALPVSAAQEAAAELEELGYGAIWFGEAWGRESLTQAASLLAGTRDVVIASGITSIHGRDPVAARAAQSTLEDWFPGRFLLGLGVSHRPMVERFRKGEYGSPLTEMERYLDGMDGFTPVSHGGGAPAPRVLAALGPRMLELSRDRAAGTHPYNTTPDHTARAREIVGPEKLVAVEVTVALTEDRDEFLAKAHTHLNLYTGLPNYRNNWTRSGFDPDVDYVRGGSERLKEAIVAHGSVDDVAARVKEHLDAGADHVCVQVLGDPVFVDIGMDAHRELAPALTEL